MEFKFQLLQIFLFGVYFVLGWLDVLASSEKYIRIKPMKNKHNNVDTKKKKNSPPCAITTLYTFILSRQEPVSFSPNRTQWKHLAISQHRLVFCRKQTMSSKWLPQCIAICFVVHIPYSLYFTIFLLCVFLGMASTPTQTARFHRAHS